MNYPEAIDFLVTLAFTMAAFVVLMLVYFVCLEWWRSHKCAFGHHEGFIKDGKFYCKHCDWVEVKE